MLLNHLYYCNMQKSLCSNGMLILMLPLSFFLLGLSLHLLGTSASHYLSPALRQISETLKCQQTVAGVTLLALGNSSSDVFSALAAGGDDGSFNLQVAFVVGTSLFITTVVKAAVLWVSDEGKKVKVTKIFFLRDYYFFLFITLYLLVIALIIQ